MPLRASPSVSACPVRQPHECNERSYLFRICSANRHKLTQNTMRKDISFRYGILNVGLIKINSFMFGVSWRCVIEFLFPGMWQCVVRWTGNNVSDARRITFLSSKVRKQTSLVYFACVLNYTASHARNV